MPLATYRIQLRNGVTFETVAGLARYLGLLGVDTAYLSPCARARAGSAHGYDVVDPTVVDPVLGGPEGFARMRAALEKEGIGILVDIVPNHMAVAEDNRFLWDALENGPASPYAHLFDIEWRSPDSRHDGKVLMPILGDHYGRVLESGEIRLEREGHAFHVRVYDRRLPASPRSLAALLARAARESRSNELAFVADSLARLPTPVTVDLEMGKTRRRDLGVLKTLLERSLAENGVAEAVDRAIDAVNRGAEELDAFLEAQNYRLAFWRKALYDLDYRRFFDINELVALRMAGDEVFHTTHSMVLEWLRNETVVGLRIDHPDGLIDPIDYMRRLRRASPRGYLVAEKILEPGETLCKRFPIDGTTGYDVLSLLLGIYIDGSSEKLLTDAYRELVSEAALPAEIIEEAKRQAVTELLVSDVRRLTALFVEVCETNLRFRDFTQEEIRRAITEMVIQFPVYRTYIRRGERADEHDTEHLVEARRRAEAAEPTLDPRLFAFLYGVLAGDTDGPAEQEFRDRFQQLTGPAMAKGVEDTAFYRYFRLTCLNEVGGSLMRFGVSKEAFHVEMQRLARSYPRQMIATSTHDTKRSEDTRLRIAVLSESPGPFLDLVRRLRARHSRERDQAGVGPEMEYLLYQSLLGAHPISEERILRYMKKAAREAKRETSWTRVDEAYETGLSSFVRTVMQHEDSERELRELVKEIDRAANRNSLSHLVVKLTIPGVPDIYQGTELFDYSLTDPDNRRAVDFERRVKLLAALAAEPSSHVDLTRDGDAADRAKLFVTYRLLTLRKKRPELFVEGSGYEGLAVEGRDADRVLAFERAGGALIVIAGRFFTRTGLDATVQIAEGEFDEALTGQRVCGGDVAAKDLLGDAPAAVLVRAAP